MTTIRLRRGTAAEWTETNPILDPGETGVELDTAKHKVGDGINTWANLRYHIPEPDIDAKIAASLSGHLATADPHPGYLTPAEGGALYEPIGLVAAHEAKADPHTQYLTSAEAGAAY